MSHILPNTFGLWMRLQTKNCPLAFRMLKGMVYMMASHRLTLGQYDRLENIMEYLVVSRPDLEWGGCKRESRNLSPVEWRRKLSGEIYMCYRDLYNDDRSMSMDVIDDYFDDMYVGDLTSLKNRCMHCFGIKTSKKYLRF